MFLPPISLNESERKDREQMKKYRLTRIRMNFTIIVVIEDSVGGRSAEERAAGIQIGHPILLHDPVDDMCLNNIKGIQVLEVVQ